MIRGALLGAAALALAACSGAKDDAPPKRDGPVSIAKMTSLLGLPEIEMVHLPYVDFHCQFFPEEFDPQDDASEDWHFLFATVFDDADLPADSLNARMRLNKRTRRLELVSQSEAGVGAAAAAGYIWEYRTIDAPVYRVVLNLISVEPEEGQQAEDTAYYTGTLRVIADEEGEQLPIFGNCGP